MTRDNVPVFGDRQPGVNYILRPGAYVLIHHQDRIAVVKATGGFCFPGGGQDPGEPLEETARRECREEVGLQIVIDRQLARADQLAFGIPEQQHFQKQCTFYLAHLATEERLIGEPDHQLHWMTAGEALAALTHAGERWVVAEWLASSAA